MDCWEVEEVAGGAGSDGWWGTWAGSSSQKYEGRRYRAVAVGEMASEVAGEDGWLAVAVGWRLVAGGGAAMTGQKLPCFAQLHVRKREEERKQVLEFIFFLCVNSLNDLLTLLKHMWQKVH